MLPLEAPGLTIFILLLFLGVYSTVYGLPGTLFVLVCVVVFAASTGFETITVKNSIILTVMTVIVETVDALIGVSNVKRPRLTLADIGASIVGAVAGAVLLTPLLLGPGILLGIFFGGFVGLSAAQTIEQKKLKPAFREPAKAAALRGLTICAKGTVAMGATAFTLARLY